MLLAPARGEHKVHPGNVFAQHRLREAISGLLLCRSTRGHVLAERLADLGRDVAAIHYCAVGNAPI